MKTNNNSSYREIFFKKMFQIEEVILYKIVIQ